MSDHAILKDGEMVPVDLFTWAKWFEGSEGRQVAKTEIGTATVSTVCLGLDHSFGDGPPLYFETMVFGDHPLQDEQERYSTLEEAMLGHERMCQRVREATK